MKKVIRERLFTVSSCTSTRITRRYFSTRYEDNKLNYQQEKGYLHFHRTYTQVQNSLLKDAVGAKSSDVFKI